MLTKPGPRPAYFRSIYATIGVVLNNEHRADRRSPINPPKWAPKLMRPGTRKPALAAPMFIIKNYTDSNLKLATAALLRHRDNVARSLIIDETGKDECYSKSQHGSPALSKMPCLDSLAARHPKSQRRRGSPVLPP